MGKKFLMAPGEVYEFGNNTESLAEEIHDELKRADELVKSIRDDQDYKSNVGSDTLIATAESTYPTLNNGAVTVAGYGSYAKYASTNTEGADEYVASNVSRKVEL